MRYGLCSLLVAASLVAMAGCGAQQGGGGVPGGVSPVYTGALWIASGQACFNYASQNPQSAAEVLTHMQTIKSTAGACISGLSGGIDAATSNTIPVEE